MAPSLTVIARPPVRRLLPPLRSLVFSAARSRAAGVPVRAAFRWTPALVPLTAVRRGTAAVLYEHPRPSYGTRHLLIVPSRGIRDLLALADPAHADVRAEMWRLRDWAETELGLAHAVVNAGPRQDVLQVHLHVTDGELPTGDTDFGSFEEAVLALPSLPDLQGRIAGGLSLVKPSSAPNVQIW